MVPERWLVGFASLYTTISLILVILINAAGTSIQYSHNPTKYNTTTLSNLHIVSITSYYGEDVDGRSEDQAWPTWTTQFFLNAACATPLICRGGYCGTIQEVYAGENYSYAESIAFWPICHYSKPGHTIDVMDTLKIMDGHLFGYDGVFPDAPLYYPYYPPGNWSSAVNDPFMTRITIPTALPFTLWLLGAISSFLFLVGSGMWAYWEWRYQRPLMILSSPTWGLEFIGFLSTAWPLVAYFIAICYLNSRYDAFVKSNQDLKTDAANDYYGGHPFLIVAWCAVLSQSLAAIFTYNHWRREKRRALERIQAECRQVREAVANTAGPTGRDHHGTELGSLRDNTRSGQGGPTEEHDPPPPYPGNAPSAHEEDC